MRPERMVDGQRLRLGHVQRGEAEAAGIERRQQRRLIEHPIRAPR